MHWTRMLVSLLLACLAPLAAQPPVNLEPDTLALQAVSRPQESPALSFEARGDIFMARKMYREAIEVYSKATPVTSVVLNKSGIAYHQLASLDTAKKYYERSIKLNPKYAEAINNLGTIHYAQKSYRRAISTYKKALALSPDSASMLSNLGTAYFARKDYKEAMVCYEKALSLDPEVFEHRGTTGVLLQERSVGERAKFHYYLAKTYAKAGRNDLALLYVRKSLEEGFKDRKKYLEEVEFAELRKVPEFETLMKLEPRVL
ncbi:MAG: tetratricopeptide repeat protein [Candidatus Solibacter usitatus]|nr:tetratricopeptide repeat protein [Candidatus Solibacter usitatus]